VAKKLTADAGGYGTAGTRALEAAEPLVDYGGRGATIAALSLLMAAVALAAALARSVREPPELELRPEVRPAPSV
jgi:hypothetical protein